MIPLAQTWSIVEAICGSLSPIVITCVVNHCRGFWLLLDDLVFAIKLYVKLTKEILKLQGEVDAIKEMDMCI